MTGKKRTRLSTESRLDEIKAAAVKQFYRRGYAAADLRAIAEDVGLHVSSLYNYMQSKEELLYLIAVDQYESSVADLNRALDGITDPAEQLRQAIRSHVMLQARMQYPAWTIGVEIRMLTGEYAADMAQRMASYEATWCDLVEAAIASGQVRPVDTRVTVNGLLTIALGVARWFNPCGRLPAEAVADEYADMLLRGLLADRAAE